MHIELGRTVEITKRAARYITLPVIVGSAALATTCNETQTRFPPCSKDPQTKSQRIKINEIPWAVDKTANVDGVKFSVDKGNPRRIDIEAKDNRVRALDEKQFTFEGLKDGRIYTVAFPKIFPGGDIELTVEATCKTRGQ